MLVPYLTGFSICCQFQAEVKSKGSFEAEEVDSERGRLRDWNKFPTGDYIFDLIRERSSRSSYKKLRFYDSYWSLAIHYEN